MTDSTSFDFDADLVRFGHAVDLEAPTISIDELLASSLRAADFSMPPRRGPRPRLLVAAAIMLVVVAMAALTKASHDRAKVSTATTSSVPSESTFVPDGHVIADLSIPSIGVHLDIREGIDEATLRNGPGHDPSSAPLGRDGRSVVFGHRTTYDAPFADLDKLQPGDMITITTSTGQFAYRVQAQPDGSGHRITTADVTLEPTATATLTLESYAPRYSAANRIIVDAALV
jgi:LPXTG-site transpeptidase (sortase) family protein